MLHALRMRIKLASRKLPRACSVLLAIPCTVAHQVPLSIGFPGQEYCSGLPFPSPGDLPYPGIETMSPGLLNGHAYSLPLSHEGTQIFPF